ncbi:MAG TPA: hypothetical protein VGG99_22705 [Acetobacteraceae bacterium]|jgi:hypothetical protein
MEHILADQGLRVTCLGSSDAIDEFDDCMFVDEWGGGLTSALHPWRGRLLLADQDVLVLVRAKDDDRPLGLIAASQRSTDCEPFLLLEAAYVSPHARHRNLLQRMIAFTVLSLARQEATPSLIAVCAKSEAYRRNIEELRPHFTGASVFPMQDAPAIDLSMAKMAQRIARRLCPEARYAAGSGTFYAARDRDLCFPQQSLLVIDLGSNETAIAADARRLYRRRPSRRADQLDAGGDWRGTKCPVPGAASNLAPSQINRPRR